MSSNCKVMVLLLCCFAATAFASPNPVCYNYNPKCTIVPNWTGYPRSVCPAGEKPYLLKEYAPAHCRGVYRLSKEARVAVRNHLLARGEFHDVLSVRGGIEVAFKSLPREQQVGELFALTAKIKDKQGASIQGKAVELLVLAGGRIIPALLQWERDDMDASAPKISGVWRGSKVTFSRLFLTRDLPQNSQLVVVARGEQGSYMFYAQAFPFSSRSEE